MSDVIHVEGVHKWYGDNHAVNGVSLHVREGEIFGILGPNGAGKTTMVEMMEGLRKRDDGLIQILGMDPDQDPYELRERIGVQFQSTSIQPRMKVGEAIRLFSSLYRKKTDTGRLIRALGLTDRLNAAFEDLSGGWKQRVTLVLATIHDPDLIFLDEPSTGLDPRARRELWDLILSMRDSGKTVVLTTHYMEEAERLCDRVAMFRKGQLVALDTPKELIRKQAGNRRLTFESPGADSGRILRLPGVDRVEQEGELVRVYATSLQQVARSLFNLAEQEGWTIEGFRFESGTLDDLFVSMAVDREGV
ncbi:ATP-binding cassette domain-containing protein [Kroppenstedtia eburnea]|uniref:ABC transporter ATP-binding protein n=1 Tax=Kroppenstedtia eburnea TaxID=714067 RepID=UPI0036290B88